MSYQKIGEETDFNPPQNTRGTDNFELCYHWESKTHLNDKSKCQSDKEKLLSISECDRLKVLEEIEDIWR